MWCENEYWNLSILWLVRVDSDSPHTLTPTYEPLPPVLPAPACDRCCYATFFPHFWVGRATDYYQVRSLQLGWNHMNPIMKPLIDSEIWQCYNMAALEVVFIVCSCRLVQAVTHTKQSLFVISPPRTYPRPSNIQGWFRSVETCYYIMSFCTMELIISQN